MILCRPGVESQGPSQSTRRHPGSFDVNPVQDPLRLRRPVSWCETLDNEKYGEYPPFTFERQRTQEVTP